MTKHFNTPSLISYPISISIEILEQPAHLPTPPSDIERQGSDRPERADFDYSRSLLPSLNPPPTNKKKRNFREEKMASTRPAIYFLLLLPFLLSSCFADQALMRDVCSRTSVPDDCFTYLSVDPRSVTANKRGLARISIQLGVRGGSNIRNDITRLLAQTTNPDLKGDLSRCLDAYNYVVYDLRTALGEFDQGNFHEVMRLLASAGDGVDNCDQEFNVPPGTPATPIVNEGNITIERCRISIGLVRQA